MNLRFSPESLQDLVRLREFIAEKNPGAARRIANELLFGLEKLKVYPEIGLTLERAVQPNRLRYLYIGKYTVRYLIGDDEIVVLRLWHAKENKQDI